MLSRLIVPRAVDRPVSLETHAQRLQRGVEAPVSARWVLAQAAAFADRLDPEQPAAEAYLLPLAPALADRLAGLDPVGLHPDRIAGLQRTLRAARARHAALRTADALRRLDTLLRRRAGLLYAYAGALDRALDCLAASAAPFEAAEEAPDAAPRSRIEAAQRAVPDAALRRELQWVLDHWARPDAPADPATHVPVVDRRPARERDAPLPTPAYGPPSVGALRPLAVELFGTAEADRLASDVPARIEDGEAPPWTAPLTAARRLLRRQFGVDGPPVEGRLRFGGAPLQHDGDSAGLAVAALFCGAVLTHTRQRRRLHVRPTVALSGAVAADGSTTPVHGETLPLKVQTAFFSPQTRLVVPAAQRRAARAARDALQADFPDGTLEVVGVERLEALFYDRRLTRQRRVGRVRHAAQRLWDRRGAVAAGTVIAVLLLVIGRLLHGPIDRTPVRARFAGETLTVENAAGQALDQRRVGRDIVGRIRNGWALQGAAFGDLTGNGGREVVWTAEADAPDTRKVLRGAAVGADTLLWETPLRFERLFPNKPEIVNRTFQVRDLLLDDLTGDGRPELYAAVEHPTYFPALLLRLDVATGTIRQRYVHPGHVTAALRALDLDADGVQEVLAGAYSNAYDRPVLAVLDPRKLQGHAPTTREYAVSGVAPATHHAYLRFPATPVQRAAPTDLPVVRTVHLQRPPRRVTVEVEDGTQTHAQRPAYILVHLDDRLRPVAVGTSSGYDRLAAHLVETGRLATPPALGDAYTGGLRYWTGSAWADAPPDAP